ncbi:MAG: sulfur carrier protein ThiS [Bryobacterales bacterium]
MTPEALTPQGGNAPKSDRFQTVSINGESRSIAAGTTVSALLHDLDLPEDRVAVELDGEILKRPKWTQTEPREGARLEIVHFVGGG